MPPQLRQVVDDAEEPPHQANTMRRVTSESEISVMSGGDSHREYRVKKSKLIGMINWGHVVGTHAPQIMALGIVLLLGQLIYQVVTQNLGWSVQDMEWSMETAKTVGLSLQALFLELYEQLLQSSRGLDLFSPYVKTTALALLVGAWMMQRQKPTYLLSFATFKAPDSWKCSHDQVVEIMRRQNCFTEESLAFLKRILERSGTGQTTAWPPGIVQCLQGKKADRSMEGSRAEAETILIDIVENALAKAQVKPREIDILIINCSLFSPTPSLCAMVLSKFGMRSDVATYNLSGMGCSASLISIDLAQQLLASRPSGTKALVISTEILTPNFYHGNERGFLIQNTLFRCGGAAMVLSNSWLDGRRAWYKLLHTVRVQGTGDAAYQCVYEGEDEQGHHGVRLSKEIVKVAGKCMEKNFTMLGPLVLPLTEQAKVVGSIAWRMLIKKLIAMTSDGKHESWLQPYLGKPYVPDFKRGIDHFCIHAGGRAVIDGIEKNMALQPFHTEASRMTLLNYGNTSSSSIWYELEYIQNSQKSNQLKSGDRIMQVAFGSGFKCTSGVWLKI